MNYLWCKDLLQTLLYGILCKYFIFYTLKHKFIFNLYSDEQNEGEYSEYYNYPERSILGRGVHSQDDNTPLSRLPGDNIRGL